MADLQRTQPFMDALRDLEENDDTGRLTELFADSPEFVRPGSDRPTPQDTDEFWRSYRDQFTTVSTEFTTTQEGDDHATLEWRSKARLAAGREMAYDGVSILSFDDEGRITRFATYFDSAAFLPAQE